MRLKQEHDFGTYPWGRQRFNAFDSALALWGGRRSEFQDQHFFGFERLLNNWCPLLACVEQDLRLFAVLSAA